MSDTSKCTHGMRTISGEGSGRGAREKLKAELAVLEERMAGYLKELGYD